MSNVLSDSTRLTALNAYQVMDTAAEADFDDIAKLAAQICGTPGAFVTFVDDHRQFFKAVAGGFGTEAERHAVLEAGFCPQTVVSAAPLVIPDTTADPAHAANPATRTAGVRFYAGTPLTTPSGSVVGTLCVVDHVPRELTAQQLSALGTLGRQVVALLELRRELGERKLAEVERVSTLRSLQDRETLLSADARQRDALLNLQRAVTGAVATTADGDPTDAVLAVAAEQVLGVVPAATGSAVEIVEPGSDGQDQLVYRAAAGVMNGRVGFILPRSGSLSGLCMDQGRPLICEDVETDSRVALSASRSLGIRSMVVIPIPRSGTFVGVLKLTSDVPSAFGEADVLAAGLTIGAIVGGLSGAAEARAIEALRRSELAARQGELRLATALTVADLGTYDWDLQSDVVAMDKRSRELFGFTAGETISSVAVFGRMDPKDQDRVRDDITVRLPDPSVTRLAYDYRIHRPGGLSDRTIGSLGHVARRPDGEPERVFGVFADITDRRQAEAELAFQRQQLELIFRESPTAMALWSGDDFLFERVNPQYQDLFRGRQLVGLPLLEAVPELRGQGFDDLLREVMRTGRPFVGIETLARIVRVAGGPIEDRYFDFTYLQVLDADGRPWGVYDHAVDVTDRVLARRALEESQNEIRKALAERQSLLDAERAARAEAEQAGRMKDDFLATLSHELRTPLNAIVGWTQILRSGVSDPDDLAEGLAVIDRNARAQTQIIEDILDMSRIVSGKLRLDVQRLDLAQTVKAGVDTVQTAADAKGVRLQVMIDPAVGPISGDPSRLHQVFWNLISNSVKFTPKGGRIQILLERVNSHVEVSVIDTGEGIDAQFLPHVFDRFRQADGSTTRRHGGLGLGLSIVKQLVELHGGTVGVKSPGKGQGATFVVALPLTPIHPESVEPAIPREHPKAEIEPAISSSACKQLIGIKIVAVDDEPDGVVVIKRLLAECGAKVRTATSAAEALALIKAEPPHVLVSDIGMPGEDGYSLIRQVRALPADGGGRIYALALTAYARATDRVRALEAGFQMHLAKPVESAELIVSVAALAAYPGANPLAPR